MGPTEPLGWAAEANIACSTTLEAGAGHGSHPEAEAPEMARGCFSPPLPPPDAVHWVSMAAPHTVVGGRIGWLASGARGSYTIAMEVTALWH